ncbi:PBECR2 nuclease fold domain-containing protein [Treponema pedis]|uniref:putative barnase/colicin E5 family endoribonuclease n=1 Tax=Treponema pedis TaxID=409322 RepID=UPI001268FAEC|nr:PBECR2 nuclease fold domain-containing protein [Treponema pedis]
MIDNKDRFSDEQGEPLLFVQQLGRFIDETQESAHKKAASAGGGGGDGGEPPDDGYPEKDYPEYKGKGQEAVNFIVKQKGGQVKGAFTRPEIGDIDVVWGKVTNAEKHTGYGLSHIIDKHGMDAVNKIGEVIKMGDVIHPENNPERIAIESNNFHVGLRQQWGGKKKTWIITGFEKEGNAKTTRSNKDYTGETLPETHTTSIPQSGKKSSSIAEKINQWQKENLNKISKILENNVEPMPKKIEFTKENFDKLFKNGIDSPIEHIKIGENQFEKLKRKNREDLLAAMADVLSNPAVIIKTANNAKLYVKTYKGNKKEKNIVSVVVDKGNISVSISTHIERNVQLAKKMDSILFERTESVHGKTPHGETTPLNNSILQLNKKGKLRVVNKRVKNNKSPKTTPATTSENGTTSKRQPQHDIINDDLNAIIPQSEENTSNKLSKSIVWLKNYLSKNEQRKESAIEVLRKRLEKRT